MPTIVFMYSPKPGVSFEELRQFLEEVDQPITLSLPSTRSSRILRVLSEDAAFACLEVLEVTAFEDWERDSDTEEVKAVVKQWPRYADVDRLESYYCEEFYRSEA